MSKGYIYSIEMLIAVSILFVALVFMFRETAQEAGEEITVMKRYSWEALEFLNYNNSLREFVAGNNETVIEDRLKAVLPANFRYEVEICTLQCSDANVPDNETLVVVDYYVSGYRENFAGKKIKMWVWT